jgi:hypothetical protein
LGTGKGWIIVVNREMDEGADDRWDGGMWRG